MNSVCGLTHPKGCFGSLQGGSNWSSFPYFPPATHSLMALVCGADSAESFRGMEGLALEQAAVLPNSQQNPSFKVQCSQGFLLTLGRSYLVSIQFSHLIKLRVLFLLGCDGGEVESDVSWLELYGGFWWLCMCYPSLFAMSAALEAFQTSSSRSQKTWHNLQPFKGCVNLCSTSGFWLKEEMMVSAPGKPELSQLIQDWGCLSLGSGAHRWLRGTPDVRSLSQILGWKSCSSPLFLREMMNPVCQSLPCPFGNVDLQLLCVDFVQVSSASLT